MVVGLIWNLPRQVATAERDRVESALIRFHSTIRLRFAKEIFQMTAQFGAAGAS